MLLMHVLTSSQALLSGGLPSTLRRLLATSPLFSSTTTSASSVLRSTDQLLEVGFRSSSAGAVHEDARAVSRFALALGMVRTRHKPSSKRSCRETIRHDKSDMPLWQVVTLASNLLPRMPPTEQEKASAAASAATSAAAAAAAMAASGSRSAGT